MSSCVAIALKRSKTTISKLFKISEKIHTIYVFEKTNEFILFKMNKGFTIILGTIVFAFVYFFGIIVIKNQLIFFRFLADRKVFKICTEFSFLPGVQV